MGSAAAGRVSTIDANRDLLIACLEHVAPLPALVVGNSMGGLVAMAGAATGTAAIDRLVLVDPAVPPTGLASLNRTTLLSIALPSLPLAGPSIFRAATLRRSPAQQVAHTLDIVCSDSSSVAESYVRMAIELTERRRAQEWAARSFSEAGRSMLLALTRRSRFRTLVHSIACQVLIVHGSDDTLVPVASIDALARERPDWAVRILEGVGHVPPIESPRRLASAIPDWVGGGVSQA